MWMYMCESTAVITEEESGRHEGGKIFSLFLNKSVTIATLEAEAEREGDGVKWGGGGGGARDLVTIATHKGTGRKRIEIYETL